MTRGETSSRAAPDARLRRPLVVGAYPLPGWPTSTRQDGRPLSIEQERHRAQREQEDHARTHDRQPRHHWPRTFALLEAPGDLARMPCEQHGGQTHEERHTAEGDKVGKRHESNETGTRYIGPDRHAN